ncbi:MAG: redoxin domain-containing protein [Nitrospira sp.]|nr:redoxin domain-containing protein [Nitrospira sp.]
MSKDLAVGQAAPELSIPDQHGKTVTLKSFKGKQVVLYFYPKDDTPGCTKESCDFRDVESQILRAGGMIVDEARVQDPIPGIDLQKKPEQKPMPDAAVEIGRLTQFYYKIVYVVPSAGSDEFQASTQVRAWVKANQFPSGYILVLPPGNDALGIKIDELRTLGWNAIKVGIGRTKVFAEAFLQRRLDAVIVPEPPKSEIPRKAKTAKEWKEIRKKL